MDISDRIKDRINNLAGDVGIYFYNFQQDRSCFAGNCDVFTSLGIAKLILLIAVYGQVEEGIICLDDTYILDKKLPFAIPEDEYEETVGILDFLHKGMELTIEDLIFLMIVISDNSAFNILLSIVGMDNVNAMMKKLGLTETKIGCMLFEWDEREPQKENYHSVREVGSLLKRMYKRQLISNFASERMLKLMSYHQRREVISYYFAQKISVAQQTGFDICELHEAAIVMSDSPFVLCMSIKGIDSQVAKQVMKDVVRMCGEESER